MVKRAGKRTCYDGIPSAWWLNAALISFTLNGGEETKENRVALTLVLLNLFGDRFSATRAGIEVARRQRAGTL